MRGQRGLFLGPKKEKVRPIRVIAKKGELTRSVRSDEVKDPRVATKFTINSMLRKNPMSFCATCPQREWGDAFRRVSPVEGAPVVGE